MLFKYIYFQFVASLICKLSLPATATKTKQLLNLPAPQVQRSLSLTYRILCIWIGIWIRQWNWDRDWEWHLDWVGCTCMQLDKYAFGSNYTAKTGEPLPSLRMLIGGRQDRTRTGRTMSKIRNEQGPIDPNSVGNPFRHVQRHNDRQSHYTI